MSSKNIKGITVEIGGDVTKLSSALTSLNKPIKDTQSQLKDVERLLKLDPTNTDLLQQRQRLLAQAVAETKTKLDTLKEAEKQAQTQFKEGKISQDQYDALKREIIATEQSLKSLEDQTREFGNVASAQFAAVGEKLHEVGNKISGAGTKLLPLTAAITGLGALSFKSAAELEDAIGATEQVFGSAANEVKNWSEELESYYGVAKGEALEYSNMMGSMLQNIGNLSEKEAAKQSRILIELAADLAAMYGGTTEDAVQALTGALKGNNTMLDNYGMAVTEATIKTKALEMGLISEGEQIDLASKQAATLALIMEQSSAAQGQAQRESEGASGSMREMTTEIKNLSSSFGELLIPIITPLIQKLSEFVQWMNNLDEGTKQTIITILGIVAAVGPLLIVTGNVVSAIGTVSTALSFLAANPVILLIAAIIAIIAAIALFGDEIQEVFGGVDDFLQNIFAKDWTESFGVFGNVLNGFFANIKNIWDAIARIFNGVIDFIRGVFTGDWERAWSGIKNIFGGIFDMLLAIAKAPLNGIIALLNGAIEGLNFLIRGLNKIKFDIPDWVPFLGGKTFGIKINEIGKIAYLANGGILSKGSAIVGENAPELLTMLGGKAVVQPLPVSRANNGANMMGGSTVSSNDTYNINVYGYTVKNDKELARTISEEIQFATTRKAEAF